MDLIALYIAAAAAFGLVFGSFLNVCIYRLPRGLSVVAPRSACPNCGKPIAAYDNIPVLSWVILGGKCRNCKAPITPRYAAVELLTGLMFALCAWHFTSPIEAVKYMVFSFLLIGLIFTDCENRLLPDTLTLTGFLIGLGFSLFVPLNGVLEIFLSDKASWRILSLGDAVLAGVLGGGFIWAVGELYFRLRGLQGMGFGDVKLLLMIGAFVATRLTLLTICIASLAAALIGILIFPAILRKRREAISLKRRFVDEKRRSREAYDSAMRCMRLPYGSFLGAAAIFCAFLGERIFDWYIRLF